jgi:hypothetical protein
LNLVLKWIAANGLGWACGIGVVAAANFHAASYPAVGAAVGAAGWWVLRDRTRRPAWWIAAAVVAWFVGVKLGVDRGFLVPDPLWAGIAGGGLAGLLQWLLLRGQLRWPMVWVATSVVSAVAGWIGGSWVGWGLYNIVPMHWNIEYVGGALAGGLVIGALSATVLARCLPAVEGNKA